MIRQFVIIIIIFFCRMHCFLFKSVNKDFSQLSKRYFKTCLSIHYKLCDSLEELQTFLRPMFVSITMIWCPMFCYYIYYTVKEVEKRTLIILVDFIIFIFLVFIFILSIMIARVDVEAKKGLHWVYGKGIKSFSNKQTVFPVSYEKMIWFL